MKRLFLQFLKERGISVKNDFNFSRLSVEFNKWLTGYTDESHKRFQSAGLRANKHEIRKWVANLRQTA